MAAPTAQGPAMGSLYGLPGITRYTEQLENNDGVTVVLSQASQKDALFPANFKQSDVVFDWQMLVYVNPQTYTAGTSTITTSSYFPYSYLGPGSLNLQNQFDTVKWLSGIDLAIWQMIRPTRSNAFPQALELAPVTEAYSADTNNTTASNYTTASTSLRFTLDLPGGIDMDLFQLLDSNGQLVTDKAGNPLPPMRAFVSPQYMAGSQRIIQPKVRFNPGSATTLDNGPANIGAGTGTFAGTATLGFSRNAIYQPQGTADSPLIYNWQYVREATQFTLSGVTKIDLPIPFSGQIMSVFYRFYDPLAAAGLGAPIATSTVNVCNLQFGSGLYRFQDAQTAGLPGSLLTQRRLIRQHNLLMPAGVLIHDMGIDDYQRVTNTRALNTLDTSGVQVHLEFASALSAAAYVVIGVEGFRYVALQ